MKWHNFLWFMEIDVREVNICRSNALARAIRDNGRRLMKVLRDEPRSAWFTHKSLVNLNYRKLFVVRLKSCANICDDASSQYALCAQRLIIKSYQRTFPAILILIASQSQIKIYYLMTEPQRCNANRSTGGARWICGGARSARSWEQLPWVIIERSQLGD